MNDELLLTVGEVAALIGLSPHTIRTWERRYDLLTPRRSLSNQRRYSLEDVETLKRVKQIRAGRGGSLRLAIQEATGALVRGSRAATSSGRPDSVEAAPESVWRTAADLYVGPVVIIGPRGCVLDCNLAFARLVDQERKVLRGTLFVDLVDPGNRLKAAQFCRRPLTKRQGWELNLKVPEGVQSTYSFDGAPARHRAGALLICRATPMELPGCPMRDCRS
jgi:PAS domain-containing protein